MYKRQVLFSCFPCFILGLNFRQNILITGFIQCILVIYKSLINIAFIVAALFQNITVFIVNVVACSNLSFNRRLIETETGCTGGIGLFIKVFVQLNFVLGFIDNQRCSFHRGRFPRTVAVKITFRRNTTIYQIVISAFDTISEKVKMCIRDRNRSMTRESVIRRTAGRS